jgi:hypothetical protein
MSKKAWPGMSRQALFREVPQRISMRNATIFQEMEQLPEGVEKTNFRDLFTKFHPFGSQFIDYGCSSL